ncbi:methylenetetrahydrofolate reductase [Thermosulfurimonas marina]|uniref:Methylenetetrahydrofolate reductase n=1 Tax=Thermosulfurimonas marina TaxID=2047767 RepID=A0A6H1WTR6_9BACT|nr:methylenetetrahydrofolate reductase C-terminal domain-containing protein [Thermosulfurimonas marina]QJA06615.1 methylenetetrahydrofolate reductase [Thermosulfurimonas marina]
MSRFAEILQKKDFVITFELVPGRSTRTRHFRDIMRFAEEVAGEGLFDALSITDNAGGHPALAPEALGRELKRLGHEPIIHFSCKDKNRNVIESDLLALDREGLRTLLVITGDYPRYGYRGRAKPVFDLDSVQLLRLISEMRRGYRLPPEVPGGGVTLPPVPLFPGCVVNPFKWTEAETLLQYWKLLKKIRAGAAFAITQVGFSARKYQELLFFLKEEGQADFPVLAGILVMDRRLARILYRGAVPGITVPEGLYRRLQGLSEEEARAEALERAARLMAVCRGLGYRGVHLCGAPLELEAARRLLSLYEEYRPRWREFLSEFAGAPEKAFFLYPRDPESGLNLPERRPLSPARRRSPVYLLSRAAHGLFFARKGPLVRPLRALAHRISGSRGEHLFTRLEYWIKKVLFECQECGDCTLPRLAFLCPQSQCAKYLLNGPCGGSRDRWCEVYPGLRRCVYVRAYERLSPEERRKVFLEEELPPRNWSLFRTSSWLNFYLGRSAISLSEE